MPLVKIGSKNQVTIPKEVRDRLGVAPGDYVEVDFRRDKAVIKRKSPVGEFPETDEPIGPETRANLRQALKEVKEGKVIGPFSSMKECIDDLNKRGRTSRT